MRHHLCWGLGHDLGGRLASALLAVAAAAGCSAPQDNAGGVPESEANEAVAATTAAVITPYSVMDDAEKRAALLEILENYLPTSEGKWNASPGPHWTGFFTADGIGEGRGEASLAYAYATLLYASPDSKTVFGPAGHTYSRSQLEDHLRQTIRHVCYTNKFKVGASGTWGGSFNDPKDQGSPIAFQVGWASFILQKLYERRGMILDQDTRDATREVVTAQANFLLSASFLPGSIDAANGNTRAEENAWHSSVLALAAAVYDPDTNNAAWDQAAKSYSINASSRASDENDNAMLDGKTVAQWVTTVNLSEDLTLTNHDFFHPVYSQAVFQTLLENAIAYRFVGATPAAAFQFRMTEVWEGVMAPLSTGDADFLGPAGTDWVTHDYQHLPYLAGIATRLQRNDASVLESRAISLLRRRQEGYGGQLLGSLYGMSDIGYEADVLRYLAEAWFIHNLFGPTPTPTEAEFKAATSAWDGVRHLSTPDRKVIVNRSRNVLATMSWSDVVDNPDPVGHPRGSHPSGFIVPPAESHLDDAVMIQPWVHSGPGAASGPATYNCDCNTPGFFSTAGIIDIAGTSVDRFYSMTSWADGTTLLLDRGAGATFVTAFENAVGLDDTVGLVGARPVYTKNGVANPGTLDSPWYNVADRYGVAAGGHQGFFLEDFADSSPNDASTMNPHRRLEAASDQTVRNRGALVLPEATAQQTALAAQNLDLSGISQNTWSAMSVQALDGTGRIAVARWGGTSSANVTVSSPLGAPIPDLPTPVTVQNNAGTFSYTLNSTPYSTGFKNYFWVSGGAVTAQAISETLIRLTTGATNPTLVVRYADGINPLTALQFTQGSTQVRVAQAFDQGVIVVLSQATSEVSGHEAAQAFDGTTSTSSYWSSLAQTLGGASTVELIFDLGRKVDLGSLTMLPRANLGPKNYTVEVADDIGGPWVIAGTTTNASATASTTTTLANPARARLVKLTISAAYGSGPTYNVGVREVSLGGPALDVDSINPAMGLTGVPQMRLARGGYNRATVRVRNNGASATNVTLSVTAPSTVTATMGSSSSFSVPAGGYVDKIIDVSGSSTTPITGSAKLTVTANTTVVEDIWLLYTDNLALNDTGSTFPQALSSSEDPAYLYPAKLANDGDTTGTNDFWASGLGTLSSNPQCLTIDLGSPRTVRRVVMTPRTNYGPKTYSVQVSNTNPFNQPCSDSSGWSTAAPSTTVANGAVVSSTFTTPLSRRFVRLKITAAHSSTGEQPQVSELQIYPN